MKSQVPAATWYVAIALWLLPGGYLAVSGWVAMRMLQQTVVPGEAPAHGQTEYVFRGLSFQSQESVRDFLQQQRSTRMCPWIFELPDDVIPLVACIGCGIVGGLGDLFEEDVGLPVDHAIALLAGRASNSLGQMPLASPRRAEQERVFTLLNEAGSSLTSVASSMRRSDHPSRPSAMTCCFLSSLKTLPMPRRSMCSPLASTSRLATCGGRFSAVDQWPVLGVPPRTAANP
jgi:hypothetical protein